MTKLPRLTKHFPRKKILISITNRASYSKAMSIIANLVNDDLVDVHLLLGGSLFLYRYGNAADIIMQDFPNLPFYKIGLAAEGDDLSKMVKTVGMGCLEISTVFEQLHPDLVVTIADRFETMATAVSASYMNIPLAHVQGGEITGTIDDKVRWAITMLSDYHFPSTEKAKIQIQRNYREWGDDGGVYNYGCPSMDQMYQPPLESPYPTIGGTGATINFNDRYVLVMFHPDTTEHIDVNEQAHVLSDVLKRLSVQQVIMWPNIDSGSDEIAKVWREHKNSNAHFLRNLNTFAFSGLLAHSSCIIGNSSAGIREASFIGVPSVNIGNRQQMRERADNVIDVTFNSADIVDAINCQLNSSYAPSNLYGDGNAGQKIARKLMEIVDD